MDVGINEEHAVGLASGLAIGGKKPVVAIYSTFLQRAIDQMAIDVALPNFNVVFCIDRAGLVGDDGPTHNGVYDLVYTRMIPNMKVFVPSDEAELVNGLHTALQTDGPMAIRYPRGEGGGAAARTSRSAPGGKVARACARAPMLAILAFGDDGRAAKAAELLGERRHPGARDAAYGNVGHRRCAGSPWHHTPAACRFGLGCRGNCR